MASETKKRKIMLRYKKGVTFDGGKLNCGRMKGVAKFSSSQRRKENIAWRKEIINVTV